MYGVIHSTNLQIQCLQRIWDGSNKLLTLRQLQFIARLPLFRWIYLSLLCAIVRETVNFLASVVCMGKHVLFFVNVKVCFPRLVIHVRIQRGGQGVRTPLENYKNTGFLSKTGPDPLKTTKLPIQHLMLGHHRPASETPFKWRFAGGPLMAR